MIAYIAILVIVSFIYLFVRKKRSKSDNKENDLVNFSSRTQANTTTITIDLNEKELLKRIEDKGFIQANNSNEDLVGFYGTEQFSPNKMFCVVYSRGYYENDKWIDGHFAVVHDKKLLFKKRIARPNDCYVSNNGISICCDWLNTNNLEGQFTVFNHTGEQIFQKKTTANLGFGSISDDGKIAIFETYNSKTEDSNQIFLIDIENCTVLNKFDRPYSFVKAQIDTEKSIIELIDNKKFIYKIDYSGNQTNKVEYELQILEKGSIYDKLYFYSKKPDDEKYQDNSYLHTLTKAIKDKDANHSFGLDRIYRLIGEYHKANGDFERTIENWEKAIEINPKVGVKRQLEKLKSKK